MSRSSAHAGRVSLVTPAEAAVQPKLGGQDLKAFLFRGKETALTITLPSTDLLAFFIHLQ